MHSIDAGPRNKVECVASFVAFGVVHVVGESLFLDLNALHRAALDGLHQQFVGTRLHIEPELAGLLEDQREIDIFVGFQVVYDLLAHQDEVRGIRIFYFDHVVVNEIGSIHVLLK